PSHRPTFMKGFSPGTDSRTRFSGRVEDYRRYRPGYPPELIALLQAECHLSRDSIVADIGSGAGTLTQLLLPHSKLVYAVEPNHDMRIAAEDALGSDPGFVSINGSAESTTLKEGLVDVLISAQAFHWFDRTAARQEFRRILMNDGWVVLVWNNRLSDADAFHRELEKLFLDELPEYHRVKNQYVPDAEVAEFFSPMPVRKHTLPNEQQFDLAGFEGRVLSASYV